MVLFLMCVCDFQTPFHPPVEQKRVLCAVFLQSLQLLPPLFLLSGCAVSFLKDLKEHRDTQTTLKTVTHIFDIKKEEERKRVKKEEKQGT